MVKIVDIYKEKKNNDTRMVIIPFGKHKIGARQTKDYAIVFYLDKKNIRKLGEFIWWAFEESDEATIENHSEIDFGKQFFNCISYKKISSAYELLSFTYEKQEYILELSMKDGYGYSPFKDKEGNECKYIFKEKPSAEELGEKVMEMFEFKEDYDNSNK
ncbi:hypothetical protein [Fusobacterium russii]|uniref:hypothetical protein n=1 Tax=Fusobacterium russii TaxID=854 RepID=UPI0003A0B0DA|nr:hypothetical protein [Fusobacterium russii]